MLRVLLLITALFALGSCGRSTTTMDDDAFFGITTTDNPSYTYLDFGQCQQLCELPCTRTVVDFAGKKYDMYNCTRLKVIKTSLFDNLKGGSLKTALIAVVVGTLFIIFIIACGYYCCCTRKDDDKYIGRDEFREIPHDERKALNKGSSVIEV